MMIKPLANPDRNPLLPLLLVCRRFYGVAIPILYESISVAPSKKYITAGPNYPSSTMIVPERFHVLYQALTSKPYLAAYIKTIISNGGKAHTDSDWKSFQLVLASVTGLRRLSIFPSFPRSPSIELVRPEVRLTHLTHPTPWDENTYEFIRSQKSLEYLRLGPIAYGKDAFVSTFSGMRLPNLRVLKCDNTFLSKLEGPSLLEHLSSSLGGSTPNPSLVRAIRSFKGDDHSWRHFSRSCGVIEYVYVTTVCNSYIEDTLAACSQKIKYLYYIDNDLENDPHCDVLFKTFPDLVVIDFDRNEFGCFRYNRGVPEPEKIYILDLDEYEFRNWHELVEDAVEEATRKNRLG